MPLQGTTFWLKGNTSDPMYVVFHIFIRDSQNIGKKAGINGFEFMKEELTGILWPEQCKLTF